MAARVILVQRMLEGEQCMLHELRELAEAAGYEVVGELAELVEHTLLTLKHALY